MLLFSRVGRHWICESDEADHQVKRLRGFSFIGRFVGPTWAVFRKTPEKAAYLVSKIWTFHSFWRTNLIGNCLSSWKETCDLFLWHMCLRTVTLFGLVWLMSLLLRSSKACASSGPMTVKCVLSSMFNTRFDASLVPLVLLSTASASETKTNFHMSGTMTSA